MTTTIIFSALLALALLSVLLWAVFLRLGLRWAKVEDVTIGRIVRATILVVAIQILLTFLFCRAPPPSTLGKLVFAIILETGVGVLLQCIIISKVFKARFLRATQAWLATNLCVIVMLPLALFVFKPFVAEAFIIPTNSMAPTLLGEHLQATCAECGSPAFCSAPYYGESHHRLQQYDAQPAPMLMICDNFHAIHTTGYDKQAFIGDRLLAAKFLEPRRWDMVVFRYPEEPSTLYVKRLVGMPGEEITIKDGKVFADGKPLTPPDSIAGIKYLSSGDQWPDRFLQTADLWGSPSNPAKLGDDEYFMLGDFSACAKDSRFWQQGAPGHNPYAVPKSYVKGVVTTIYWPPSRWRVFR